MVAEAPPALNEPLIEDVLRTLKVTRDQVLQLAPESVAMLPLTAAVTAGESGRWTSYLLKEARSVAALAN
jgi:DNA polymerase III psi subunit